MIKLQSNNSIWYACRYQNFIQLEIQFPDNFKRVERVFEAIQFSNDMDAHDRGGWAAKEEKNEKNLSNLVTQPARSI